MSKVKVLSLQMQVIEGKREENFKKVEKLLENIEKDIDLIVLPEFFSTGAGDKAVVPLAQKEDESEALAFVKNLAKKTGANIVGGSINEKDGDKVYNTSYFVDPAGDILGKYRKINLFDKFGGNEDKYTARGSETCVVDSKIGKVGLSICFDIRYPLLYAELRQKGAEIITCPTAWCYLNEQGEKEAQNARELWLSFNRARANENLVYFISSNLASALNPYVTSVANSSIVNYDGSIISNAQEKEGVIMAELDMDSLRKARSLN